MTTKVSPSMMDASGTPSASSVLHGDGVWRRSDPTGRNDIINGSLEVDQRGNTTPADDEYTGGDLFLHVGEGTPTITVESSGGPQADRKFHKIVCGANAQAGLVYFLSNAEVQDFIANGKLSFGVKLKTTTAKLIDNARIGILKWNSTADSITTDVVGTWASDGTDPTLATNWSYENTPADLALTTSWARHTVEDITVDSDTNNIGIFIWTDDGTITANDELLISEWQLNPGSTVNDFSSQPNVKSQVQDIVERIDVDAGPYQYIAMLTTFTADSMFGVMYYKPKVRTPSLTTSGVATFMGYDGTGNLRTPTSFPLNEILLDRCRFRLAGVSSAVAGGGVLVRDGTDTCWILIDSAL